MTTALELLTVTTYKGMVASNGMMFVPSSIKTICEGGKTFSRHKHTDMIMFYKPTFDYQVRNGG
jgi:hypothetical protein